MNQSEQINELSKALSQAQLAMRGAVKDSENPFFKSKYADLAAVIEAAREPLGKHWLSVVQTTEPDGSGGLNVITTLMHSSGQWIRGTLPVFMVKKDPQGMGSAITYARRYAYSAIVGIAQVDDDGEGAKGNPHAAKNNQPEPGDGVQTDEWTYPSMQAPLSTIAKQTARQQTNERLKLIVETMEARLANPDTQERWKDGIKTIIFHTQSEINRRLKESE
jgi:hypothetical protein